MNFQMKILKEIACIIMGIFVLVQFAISQKVYTYPAPDEIIPSPGFKVNVFANKDVKNSFVYYSTPLDNDADNAEHIRNEVINGINENPILSQFYFNGKKVPINYPQSCSYTCFSFEGKISLQIMSLNKQIRSFKILPSTSGIDGRIENGNLCFELIKPKKVAIVINGDYLNPLFLFADDPEQEIPNKRAKGTFVIKAGEDYKNIEENIKDASVLWFEPGIHNIGVGFKIFSNQTVYIPGGAYLRGTISGLNAKNVTIRGRGILAGDHISRKYVLNLKKDRAKYNWERMHYHAINMLNDDNKTSWNSFADSPGKGCDNLTIEGIMITSPRQFYIRATGVPITIYNVKMVGSWPYNTDGVSTIGQANTTVFDCFFHCNDDGIYVTPKDCHIRHCNFWQGNNGCVFQFAWGSAPTNQGGGFIHDCNILHVGHVSEANNRMVIGSRKSGPGDIGNIHFKNIHIDGPVWSFVRLETNGSGNLGSFENIKFENIVLDGPVIKKSTIISSKGREKDEASTSWIKNITFKNVTIEGRMITQRDFVIGDYQVNNIVFEP